MRLRSLRLFDKKPMAEWFAVNMPDIDFQDIYYYLRPKGDQVSEWDELPEEMMRTYEKLGIPEAERQYLAGVTAQYESEVVYHKNREDLAAAGDPVLRHGHRAARVPAPGQGVLRHRHPARRQQVRRAQHARLVGWLVHLRPAGRRVRDAAAGLLPDQLRERRPVRAHADHRRRGLEGALHRRLLGAGVHERLAALGRRRDRRQAARPGHVHHDPELVAERLQPGHQACPGRGLRPHGVDRRQHRLEAHDEVPVRLPGRRGRHRRGAVGRLRRRRPAPGRRRQDGARRAEHHARRSCRSRSARTAASPPTAVSCGSTRVPTAARATSSATP